MTDANTNTEAVALLSRHLRDMHAAIETTLHLVQDLPDTTFNSRPTAAVMRSLRALLSAWQHQSATLFSTLADALELDKARAEIVEELGAAQAVLDKARGVTP